MAEEGLRIAGETTEDLDPEHPMLRDALRRHGLSIEDMRIIMRHGMPQDIVSPGAPEIVYNDGTVVVHWHHPDDGRRWMRLCMGSSMKPAPSRLQVLGMSLPETVRDILPGRPLSDVAPLPGAAAITIRRVITGRGDTTFILEPHRSDQNP